ncbi:hypothetical protein SUDANB6_01350 [Streptomyces sp. enrichment culture]|uniref:thioesterase II family protein n=1 Tax=Streptomyces sp. enrichment culture TaxID=1795815 RepID=UPI003F567966
MDDLIGPIADTLEPFLGEPLALFGHSMGAVVAYEVTLELEHRHGQVIDLLAVSGSRAPHERENHDRHALDDAGLIEELRRLNADFADLLDSPELLELVLPSIRADFGVVAGYLRTPPVPVRAPLLVLGGSEDPDVSPRNSPGGGPARAAPSAPVCCSAATSTSMTSSRCSTSSPPGSRAAVSDRASRRRSRRTDPTTTGVRAVWLT